jgi:hypothetical protein
MLAREIDAATPYSWLGTPVRGGAMLLAGLADPLNVASAFMPVVREARVASILANAGESALARAGARAAIGAAEGFAGAAALELPTYGLRTAMQDDYHLTDSLLNMAFGTALGGGLHAVGGAIGDHLGGGNPYSRFAGLGTKEIRQVLDYEAGKLTDASGFSDLQRRAAGLGQRDTVPVAVAEQRVLQPAERQRLAVVSEAPFARLYDARGGHCPGERRPTRDLQGRTAGRSRAARRTARHRRDPHAAGADRAAAEDAAG